MITETKKNIITISLKVGCIGHVNIFNIFRKNS